MTLATSSILDWSDLETLIGIVGFAACCGLGWDTAWRDFEDAWALLAGAAVVTTALIFAADWVLALMRTGDTSWRGEYLISFAVMTSFIFCVSCIPRIRRLL